MRSDARVSEGKTMSEKGKVVCIWLLLLLPVLQGCGQETTQIILEDGNRIAVPKFREKARLTFAPHVPPPLERKKPALVEVHLEAIVKRIEIEPGIKFDYWTFNGEVPGPFLRARVGDTLEVHFRSLDERGMIHNLDLHGVTGPEGGALVTSVRMGEKEKVAWFKLLHPGLFLYYCTTDPYWVHMSQGMYGIMLVEPENGLPKVDKEFYIMQSELYAESLRAIEDGEDEFWDYGPEMDEEGAETLIYSHESAWDEHPEYVLFNGRYKKYIGWENSLKAEAGDSVRFYFGNAGPNLISSFSVIGEVLDRVYREADLLSPPALSVKTTLVPPGGAAVADVKFEVPGEYMFIDHAVLRTIKGAYGRIIIDGKHNYEIYAADKIPEICPEC